MNDNKTGDSDRIVDEMRREAFLQSLIAKLPFLLLVPVLSLAAAGWWAYVSAEKEKAAQAEAIAFEAGGMPEKAPYRSMALLRSAQSASPGEAVDLLRQAAGAMPDPEVREVILLKAAVAALAAKPEVIEDLLSDVKVLKNQADELRAMAALRRNDTSAAHALIDKLLQDPKLSASARARLQGLY